jgi:hypothetical protein
MGITPLNVQGMVCEDGYIGTIRHVTVNMEMNPPRRTGQSPQVARDVRFQRVRFGHARLRWFNITGYGSGGIARGVDLIDCEVANTMTATLGVLPRPNRRHAEIRCINVKAVRAGRNADNSAAFSFARTDDIEVYGCTDFGVNVSRGMVGIRATNCCNVKQERNVFRNRVGGPIITDPDIILRQRYTDPDTGELLRGEAPGCASR